MVMQRCCCFVSIFVCCTLFVGASARNLRPEDTESKLASHLERESEEAESAVGKESGFRWSSEAPPPASQRNGSAATLLDGIKHDIKNLWAKLGQQIRAADAASNIPMPLEVQKVIQGSPHDPFTEEIEQSTRLIVCICIASCWFAVYTLWIAETDRGKWRDSFSANIIKEHEDPAPLSIKPDLIMVFHHPEYKYTDQNDIVTREAFERCLSTCRSGIFKHAEELLGWKKKMHECIVDRVAKSIDFVSSTSSPGLQRSSEEKVAADSVTGSSGSSSGSHAAGPTKHNMRCAMLQDMYENLQHSGFEVQIFSSIDEDKLYLCASLVDPDVVDYYRLRDDVHSHTNQKSVSTTSALKLPKGNAAPPPYLHGERRLVEKLHEAGIVNRNDGREFYGPRCSWTQRTMDDLQRIRIIYSAISGHLDLDASKAEGLTAEWYPVHSRHCIKNLHTGPFCVGAAAQGELARSAQHRANPEGRTAGREFMTA